MKNLIALLLIGGAVFLTQGCSSGATDSSKGTAEQNSLETAAPGEVLEERAEQVPGEEREPVELFIAAAASLKNSFEETLIPLFTEAYPWISVKGTYDSSGKLQTQLEEGLEADVFMSASMKQMNALNEAGYILQGSVVELLENKIVMIVPEGTVTQAQGFEDLVSFGSIAIGDPESVPAGQYAKEALTQLGIWDLVVDKVSFATNVTEALNWVAEGSADVGIVYATDAASTGGRVTVVAEAPEGSLKQRVIYPVGILANSPRQEEATLFLEFLKSEQAQNVFEQYGFSANQ